MNINHPYRLWLAICSFALAALACNLFASAPPTAIPTQAPLEPATVLPTQVVDTPPTSPPEPTAEETPISLPGPEMTATQANDQSQIMEDVKDYYNKGYLPFENGELYLIDAFSKTRPSIDVFTFTRTRQKAQDFALWADIELDSSGSTRYPDYTGCGFAYRVQNNSIGYTAILTNEAVRMGYCDSGLRQCDLFGTTFGSGNVDVRNNSKTQFSLAVNKDRAFAFVDGMLVGQYTLFTTKLLGTGDLYYAVVSNINAGYWSSCQITNVRLWESLP